MTQDKTIEKMEDLDGKNPELQHFLETGEGGVAGVRVRKPYKVPGVKNQIRRVNARQQEIFRRM